MAFHGFRQGFGRAPEIGRGQWTRGSQLGLVARAGVRNRWVKRPLFFSGYVKIANWNMAIEIVDLPMTNGDFP